MLLSAGKNAALTRYFCSENQLSRLVVSHRRVALVRFASTVTPKSSTQTDSHVPPPNPLRGKKVDFKPAPVKPATLRPPTPARPPSPDSPSYHRPPRHNTLPQPLETSLNALALAKQDIISAAEQGVLRPPPKDATPMKRFLHQAFQLIKFYLAGLGAINTHRKQARAILARAKSGGALPSRAEQRFIETYRRDVLKLVPFLLIILVAEELVPLVALYAPRMLPSTCVLPGQRNRIHSRARNKQLAALFHHRAVFESISNAGLKMGFVKLQDVGDPGAVCRILGLPAWPSLLNRWRIHRHLDAIALDDQRLRREGCGQRLTIPELEEALRERGMVPESENPSAEHMRAHLNWWLDNVEMSPSGSDPISRRVLMLGLIGAQ